MLPDPISALLGRSGRAPAVIFGLALFALALGARWLGRDADVHVDEEGWIWRSAGFAYGLNHGLLGRTYQHGHPGVLTMELAILGQGLSEAERFASLASTASQVSAAPGYFDSLVRARRAFALATAALVVALALVAWRLFGPAPALVGGLLLAVDPFYLANSQLVHLDAVLSGCLVLAALCAIVRWGSAGGRRWVVAGGVLSGLALLQKPPALYLAVFVPLLAANLGVRRRPSLLTADLTLWGAASLLTFVLLWPSMWVDPVGSMGQVVDFAGGKSQASGEGNFFLGETVEDPGPLFYLVAGGLRLSPATTLGLLALVLVAWRGRGGVSRRRWRCIVALAAYALGFALLITLLPKKFDRYLLPAFPALDLLAGFGLWLGWRALARPAFHWARKAGQAYSPLSQRSTPPLLERNSRSVFSSNSPLSLLFAFLVVVLAIWPVAAIYPHYLTYYNPLLGGGSVAARAILVGGGEGLNEAARWLNSRPQAETLLVATHSADALQATFIGKAVELRSRVPESADYVVLYSYQTRIRRSPSLLAEYARRQPVHSVRLNGIDYASIYLGPRASPGL